MKRFCSKNCQHLAPEYGLYCQKYYESLRNKEVVFKSKGETKYFFVTPRLRKCIKDELKGKEETK